MNDTVNAPEVYEAAPIGSRLATLRGIKFDEAAVVSWSDSRQIQRHGGDLADQRLEKMMSHVRTVLFFSTILLLSALLGVTSAQTPARPPTLTLDPRLAPIAFALGPWGCKSTYFEVPPFTTAHTTTAVAVFTPDLVSCTGGACSAQWISSVFQEVTSSNGEILAVHDAITINPFAAADDPPGIRALRDSKGGRTEKMVFTVSDGILEFSGDYVIGSPKTPLVAPFTERVSYDDAREKFTAVSRVFGIPFQVLECSRIRD